MSGAATTVWAEGAWSNVRGGRPAVASTKIDWFLRIPLSTEYILGFGQLGVTRIFHQGQQEIQTLITSQVLLDRRLGG